MKGLNVRPVKGRENGSVDDNNSLVTIMRILIADDHALFRDGLRHILYEIDKDAEVVEASDFDEVEEQISDDYDLVLLDLNMPGRNPTDGVAAVRAAAPTTPLIVVSANDTRKDISDAMRAGASGFLPKTSNADAMIDAIRRVLTGHVYLPPEDLIKNPPAPSDGSDPRLARLTNRQREVLRLLAQGKSNKEIAKMLNLVEGTVKVHVTAILRAMNVNNRTHAVILAAQLGLDKEKRSGE